MAFKRKRDVPKAAPEEEWYRRLQEAMRHLPELHYVHNLTIEDVWAKKHISASHELIHVRKGQARLKLDTRIIEVNPDDTILIPKAQAHRDLRTSPGEYQVLMASFFWDAGDELLRDLEVRRLIRVPAQAKMHLRLLCHELQREALQDSPDARLRANTVLAELVTACVRYCRPAPRRVRQASQQAADRRRKRQVHAVREYLQEHHAETISLEQLAAEHNMNAFYLSRAFSREFGASITDVLAGVRMERARELLEAGELSVKQIAYQVGYMNGNYFSKVFRRYYGLSPSEFQVKGSSRWKKTS
ncbi:MAG: helix-turn-helix transcriptional regulator [Phycisphaerae bacterium]|nr:helix-turn-helix transcriptional regulator [Phycisphaerae bacterium]